MPTLRPAQRLTIYFGESDRWRGKLLYLALLEALRAQGVTGATVTRGVAGYGAHSRIHTGRLVDVEPDLPMIIEAVDSRERIEAVLDVVADMVGEGMITTEEVTAIHARRHVVPLLPVTARVGDVMAVDVATVAPETPIAEVVRLLIDRDVKAVPVVDAERRVVGIITGGDLIDRAGLPMRLSLQRELPEQLAAHHLRVLEESGQTARSIMTPRPITTRADASLTEAARLMAGDNLKRLPVVDTEGRLVAIISRLDILRVVADTAPQTSLAPPPLGSGLRVEDAMLTDVATAHPDTPIEDVLDRLVGSPLRRVVVIDAAGRVQGMITDRLLLAQALPQPRGGFWGSVRHALGLADTTSTVRPNMTAVDVMSRDVYAVMARASILDAIEQMVERRVKRLAVVDAEGRLVGMVDRQRALQVIASASEG